MYGSSPGITTPVTNHSPSNKNINLIIVNNLLPPKWRFQRNERGTNDKRIGNIVIKVITQPITSTGLVVYRENAAYPMYINTWSFQGLLSSFMFSRSICMLNALGRGVLKSMSRD